MPVPRVGGGAEDLTCHLSEEEVGVMVDLLKLAVAGRAGEGAVAALTHAIAGLYCSL